jgi:hypothetical protein
MEREFVNIFLFWAFAGFDMRVVDPWNQHRPTAFKRFWRSLLNGPFTAIGMHAGDGFTHGLSRISSLIFTAPGR